MRVATLSITLLAALAGAACRGDAVKCDNACRNVFTLTYWEEADARILKKPEADRENERSRLQAKFINEIENGVELCVSRCRSANNETQMDCMIAAKTSAQAKACFEDD
jgi:hypothetical protein